MSAGRSWGEGLWASEENFGQCIGGPRGGALSNFLGSRGLWAALCWTLRGFFNGRVIFGGPVGECSRVSFRVGASCVLGMARYGGKSQLVLRNGAFVDVELARDSVGGVICGENATCILMNQCSKFKSSDPHTRWWNKYLA